MPPYCCNKYYSQSRSCLATDTLSIMTGFCCIMQLEVATVCCNNYCDGARFSAQHSAVATWCILHYFILLFLLQQLMSQPSPVATLTLQLAIAYIYIYPLFSVATITKPAFLWLLQHSALSIQLLQLVVCCLSIYTIFIFYFYFFVATITQPALSLPVATATKLASVLSCCNLPYVFYLY